MAVDAGTIYSEIRVQLDKLKNDLNKVDAQFNKFGKQNKKQSGKVEKGWSKGFKNINLAGVAAFAGLTLIVKDSVKTFAQFEQSLANVKSVAGATDEEFEALEEAAKNAGETTRFTASQAADALYNLASAGLDAKESAAALDGVLQLAGATQSDLASTSATVTATLSQYGMEAGEASRISNTFAAAIGNSQANMEKLSQAFRQVGPVAASLGISLEETTGALQALFDAGFKGEQAGTALRNALGSLANETDPAVQKLNELGVTFEQVNPQTNDLATIIGNLGEAGLEAGDVISVFGREAGPQLLSLLRTGEQGIREYTSAVTDTNAAVEAYETQNDTLQGSIDQLGSAVESAKISFVEELSPAIRGVVDFLTQLVRQFSALPGPVKTAIAVIAAGIPVVTGITIAVKTLAGAIGTALGPISLAVTAVGAFTAAVSAAISKIRGLRQARLEEAFSDLADETDTTVKQIEEVRWAMAQFISQAQNAEDPVKAIKTALDFLKKEFGLTAEQILKITNESLNLTDTMKEQIEAVTELTLEEAALRAMHEGRLQTVEEMRQALLKEKEATSETAKAYSEALTTYQDTIELTNRIFQSGLTNNKERIDEMIAITEDYLTTLVELGKEETTQFTEIKKRLDVLKEERDALEANTEAQKESNAETERLTEIADQYIEKTQEIGRTERETMKLQQQRLRAEIQASKASKEDRAEALAAVDEYYQTLFDYLDQQKEIEARESLKAANEELAKSIDNYRDKIAELSAEEKSLLEQQRISAIERAELMEGEDEKREELVRVINRYFNALERRQEEIQAEKERQEALDKQATARSKVTDIAEEYRQKLTDLVSTEDELTEAERERALLAVEQWEMTDVEIGKATKAINKYYDALIKNRKQEKETREVNELTELTEDYNRKLEDLRATEEEMLKLDEERAIQAARELATTEEAQEQLGDTIKIIKKYYKEKREGIKTTEKTTEKTGEEKEEIKLLSDAIDDYALRLRKLTADEKELLEIQKEQAMTALKNSEAWKKASKEVRKEAKNALKAYYDALQEALSEEQAQALREAIVDATKEVGAFVQAWQKGDIQEVLNQIGDKLIEIGLQTGNMAVAIGGMIANAAANMVESIQNAQTEIERVQLETQKLIMQATRDRIEQQYQAEIDNINRIEQERLQAIRDTLSQEAEEVLVNLGILEESRSDYWDRIYQEAIETLGLVGKEERERIKEAIEAREEAEKQRIEAEKQYRQDIAQFEYDQAVFEKEMALQEAKIAREEARADLGWLGSITHGRKLERYYSDLLSAIEAMPLPPMPQFQTGGIVLPQSGGTAVNVAENGSPELLLNGGAEGEAFLNEFATRIAGMMNGGKAVTIQLDVDGKRIAENTARYYNNGKVRLKV